MLEAVLKSLAEEICARNGYSNNFDIVITNELEPEKAITIKGGSTPIIYVNRYWILEMMVKANNVSNDSRSQRAAFYSVKDKLHRAIERVPKMTRSLSLVTVREAITLRKDSKRWAIDVVPQLKNHLKDRFFEIEYNITITVKETVTGASITRSIKNPSEIDRTIGESKSSLARSIISNEEMSSIRDAADAIADNKVMEVKPNAISISAAEGEIRETNEY